MTSVPRDRQGGFALLIVLWGLVLIAFLIGHVASTGRAAADIAGSLQRRAILQAQVQGGVQTAIFHVLDQGDGYWPADGASHVLTIPGGAMTIRITDESDKINVNRASPALLAALFRNLGANAGMANDLATEIADWREAGNRPWPAKTAAYLAASLSYLPPEAPFQNQDELLLLPGMSPALLQAALPHLTLFSTAGPRPTSPDPVVRAALRDGGSLQDDAQNLGDHASVDVVCITVSATGRAGGAAVRQAVVSLRSSSSADPAVRIMAWSDQRRA